MTDSEKAFADEMRRRGWTVLKNGWPDFLLCNPTTQRGFALELKSGNDRLRAEQVEMHRWLTKLGMPIYVAYNVEDCREVIGKPMLTEDAKDRFIAELQTLKTQLASRVEAMQEKINHLERQMFTSVLLTRGDYKHGSACES